MQKYNDYIITTRQWLKHYNRFKASIDCMNEDLRMLEVSVKEEEAAPIAHYGDMPAGGQSELNSIEKAVDRKIKQQGLITQIKADIAELQRIITKVDRAMDTLDDDSRDIVQGCYIDGYSWLQVSLQHHLSESGARKKGNRALEDLALVMFGIKAKPQQLSFIFIS